MITDVWTQLQSVFSSRIRDIYPGIKIDGLNLCLQRRILNAVLVRAHDIEPLLNDIDTGCELLPRTINAVIDYLLCDNVDGMVWVEIEMDHLVLPKVGFFVHNATSLTIHYVMGMWQPITLIGLFELLRWIYDMGDDIQIEMEVDTAPLLFRQQFNTTWNAYLNDIGGK